MQGEGAAVRFEGFSIFFTIAITAIGLWLGSILPKRDEAEQMKIAKFFQNLNTPVEASELTGSQDESSRPALGAATLVVGFLLCLAGVFATSPQARWIDLGFGLTLAIFGVRFLRTKPRVERRLSRTA
jgi:hypothetical protein